MIKVSECEEKCFGHIACIMKRKECKCAFYKPKDCTDWIRLDIDGEAYLLTPEEYERRNK